MSTRSLASDLGALGRRGVDAVKAAPAWLGGILTGAQAAVLSYLLVLAPAMAVVASAPTSSLAAGIDWGASAGFATQWWLLAHGAPMMVDGVELSLVPLGLTLACGAILAGIARRFAARTWASWALAVATYAALVGVVASLLGGGTVRVLVPIAAAIALAAPSVAIGVWRAHGLELGWLSRVPQVARTGLRRAAASFLLIVCAGAVAQAVWAVVGRARIGDAATALQLDGVGGAVLAVAELAYAPTMVAWMVAWLSGQGFAVGVGTAYAPDALSLEPVPVLPLLGALPSQAGGLLVWVPAAIVLLVAVARVLSARPGASWRAEALADVTSVASVGLATAVLCLVSSGAAGPARLAVVGADALPVAVAVAGLSLVGALLGTGARMLLDLPVVRRLLRRAEPAPMPGSARAVAAATARR